MPRLPRITAREIIAVLEKKGFLLARQSGSHKIYKDAAACEAALHKTIYETSNEAAIARAADLNRGEPGFYLKSRCASAHHAQGTTTHIAIPPRSN